MDPSDLLWLAGELTELANLIEAGGVTHVVHNRLDHFLLHNPARPVHAWYTECVKTWRDGGETPEGNTRRQLLLAALKLAGGIMAGKVADPEAVTRLRSVAEGLAPTSKVRPSEAAGSAKLSPRELAQKHRVDAGALRKRLDRWRYEHDTGYVEVSNAAKNEPKYLYDESAVMPVIEALRGKPAGQKRAANGQ